MWGKKEKYSCECTHLLKHKSGGGGGGTVNFGRSGNSHEWQLSHPIYGTHTHTLDVYADESPSDYVPSVKVIFTRTGKLNCPIGLFARNDDDV